MKKYLKSYSILLAALLITAPTYSATTNNCMANFKSHIINAETAWFDDCELTDNEIPSLVSYLNTHHEITQLYALNNKISDQGALLLAKNKTLKMLELRNNLIGKKGAIALSHSSIHMLDLQGNQFNSAAKINTAKNDSNTFKLPRINSETIILG